MPLRPTLPLSSLGFRRAFSAVTLALLAANCGQAATSQSLALPRPTKGQTSGAGVLGGRAAPLTPTASTPASSTASPSAAGAQEPSIGTATPLVFAAAGSSGRWVAYCQARRDTDGNGALESGVGVQGALTGDALSPYVFVTGLGELAIDALLSHDATGRWLAVQQAERVLLIDAELGRSSELAPGSVDRRADALPYAQHRGIDFDPNGTNLLYATAQGGVQALTLRGLTNGRQSQLNWGAASLWRAAFAADGYWIVLNTIPEDTNGNGRLGWPVPELAAPRWRCQGPIPRFPSWLDRGDKPVTTLLRPKGGPPQQVPNFVATFGEAYLTREADGRLELHRTAGRALTLTPGECNAHLAHADPKRGLVVVGCVAEDPAERPKLELVGVGYRKALGIDVGSLAVDREPGQSPRLVAFYPGKDCVLLDMDRRELVRLEPGDQVLATKEQLALVRRQRTLLVFDAERRVTRELTTSLQPFPDVVVSDGKAAVTPVVVDWFQGKVLGSFAGRPLGLSREGRVLVALGRQQSASELATGPLRWLQPQG